MEEIRLLNDALAYVPFIHSPQEFALIVLVRRVVKVQSVQMKRALVRPSSSPGSAAPELMVSNEGCGSDNGCVEVRIGDAGRASYIVAYACKSSPSGNRWSWLTDDDPG